VLEEESQAVLTTLTEHHFQGAFKARQKRWEGDCFEGEGGL
jgi:hypothetical protein